MGESRTLLPKGALALEMSLKPFKSMEPSYVEGVCREMFRQWQSLLKHADIISVMLWTADGSEILEYRGNLDEEVEWGKYIGGANPRRKWDRSKDPEGTWLHTTSIPALNLPNRNSSM